jgi:hypothetical protein
MLVKSYPNDDPLGRQVESEEPLWIGWRIVRVIGFGRYEEALGYLPGSIFARARNSFVPPRS